MNQQTPIPGLSIEIIPNIVSTDNWYKIKADKRREDLIREGKKIVEGKLKLRDEKS